MSSTYNQMASPHNIKIIKSDFIDCFSPTCGGGIRIFCLVSKAFIYDCSFISCYANTSGYDLRGCGGGAFVVANASSFYGCYFENCSGTSLGQGCFIESTEANFSCCSEYLCGIVDGVHPNVICFEKTIALVDCFNTTNSQFEGKFGILHTVLNYYEMKYVCSYGNNPKASVIASSTRPNNGEPVIHHSSFANYSGSCGVIFVEFVKIRIEYCVFNNCKGDLPYILKNPDEKVLLKKCYISAAQNTVNATVEDCHTFNGESIQTPGCVIRRKTYQKPHARISLVQLAYGIITGVPYF